MILKVNKNVSFTPEAELTEIDGWAQKLNAFLSRSAGFIPHKVLILNISEKLHG